MQVTTGETNEEFHWHDGFLLGHPPMDALHQEFVDTVSQLMRSPDDALAANLARLMDHLHRHFEEENQWMRETDFPARDCHIDEHAAVMRTAEEIQPLVELGNFAEGRRFVQALIDWFPGHADYLDSALSHWMCKRRLGGKPVVLRRNIPLIHNPPTS